MIQLSASISESLQNQVDLQAQAQARKRAAGHKKWKRVPLPATDARTRMRAGFNMYRYARAAVRAGRAYADRTYFVQHGHVFVTWRLVVELP